jgi:RHS repeat-associated protein
MPNGALRVYEYAGHGALVPLAFTDYASADASPESGKHYTVFTDPVGQPLQIEDAKGQLVWFASRVDPYGHIEVHPASQLEYNLRWPGHYYDPETALHYNRYRYYDPGLGRYLQTDPLGYEGSPTNLYGYPANPLTDVDVLGLAHPARGSRSSRGRSGDSDGAEGTLPRPVHGTDSDARRPATPAELAAARQAMVESQRAVAALPESMQQKTASVASNNPSVRTLSGFDPPPRINPDGTTTARTASSDDARARGFVRQDGVNDAPSMIDHSRQIGHEPVRSGASDQGLPGASSATHAEKQMSRVQTAAGTETSQGVSREQCGDCRGWFQREAQATGQRQIVADPVHTRVYHPDGSVDVHNTQTGQLVQSVPAGTPPTANMSPGSYEGNPW